MPLVINGQPVDPTVIDQEFSAIKAHYESLAQVSCCERDQEFMGLAKENIIDRVLLTQEAERLNEPILKKEVDDALQSLMDQQGGRESFIAHTGLSAEGEKLLRRDLACRIRIDRLVDRICGSDPEPDESELRRYYQEHLDDFHSEEEIRVSHIFKSLRKSENRDALYRGLLDIRRRAQAGEDFDALAREVTDKDVEDIDLGYFRRGEHMDEFETIVFSMDAGEVSPIFGTHWGFHLAKVTGRRPATAKPFEEVRDTVAQCIIEEQRKARLDAFLAGLKEKAEIADTGSEADPAPLPHHHQHL
ncbi:MAG TPA: peptidyl-prolyl cis-trans isomerase [Verrucomicrobiales bacterium]|nr:peptidyl-prolyl cis-trans isomerase [Verrucomicrobiales bacterium]